MFVTEFSDPEVTIEELVSKLELYLPADSVCDVRRAYYYAQQAHEGQTRRSGEPYVTHPLAVANILADMRMDPQSLMAAMLHDVIEDTGIPKSALANQFSETVADLVDGVSKLTQIESASKAEMQAENFQKMAMAMARDIRVILVKLADRLHNMRTLGALRPDKRRRIARETLEIYAPIANRLGMNDIRLELEDRGFHAMYPMRSTRIQHALTKVHGNRKEVIQKAKDAIEQCLKTEGHSVKVTGREKHLWSIYQKMRNKQKSFSEIMDVFAFRIVTDTVDQCYRVLGCIHNLYKPVPGAFKDYIAIPKANGYQSLHTILVGLHGVPIEVQIRTKDMDAIANTGIASHSLYKSEEEGVESTAHSRTRDWIKGLLELQQKAGNPVEFVEHVKVDLFPDEVYVFTPKGSIIELPQGATAVDFAYAVHTEVGNKCVAARINNRLSPLSQPLLSGQNIRIITSDTAHPNPAWLDFVVSGKARAAVRHFMKNQQFSESIVLGRRMLDRVLVNQDVDLDSLDQDVLITTANKLGFESFELLLEAIGLGNQIPYLVTQEIIQAAGLISSDKHKDLPLVLSNTDGVVMSYAGCCRPIPGDVIVGRINPGKGIVIHRDNCRNIEEFQGKLGELTPVTWASKMQGDFLADVRVELENHRGVFASLAALISDEFGGIDRVDIVEKDAGYAIINLTLDVRDRVHLAHILKKIYRQPWSIKASRRK